MMMRVNGLKMRLPKAMMEDGDASCAAGKYKGAWDNRPSDESEFRAIILRGENCDAYEPPNAKIRGCALLRSSLDVMLYIGGNMAIEIDGRKYKVTENIGYSHDMGCYVKAVATEHGERIAVKVAQRWVFRCPIASINLPAKLDA